MNMEQLKEFVALETRKRELDSELKSIAARIDDLEQTLVPQFLSDGVASMKVDGRTVYIAQDIHASPANDRAEVIAALKRSELGQYVSENYNTQSLRAFVREVADEVRLRCQQQNRLFTEEEVRTALPKPLAESLKVSFVHSLRSRKA
jgi:CHAT domain-containing protein